MRVNLIHSKLVFQISKKKYCSRSREHCEWNQFTAMVFWKKKRTVHFNEQCREEKQPRAALIFPAF
jgi:hypothetical protein